ncbi:hypothetical protein ACO0LF_24155 [Undibacterium sp. Di27W]|uniref:hypothetical protein n=1 Tax=Undibacterium sp. Di27W TaxID=3413036 RepID=UPI003BF0486C
MQNNQVTYLADLDVHGDIAPPWEKFPDYDRYTIGWRMGAGETWLKKWKSFIRQMPDEFELRLAYLKRHPAAPYSWADFVQDTLHPMYKAEHAEDDRDQAYLKGLQELGLIASDIAYPTWLAQQDRVAWPWELNETPEEVARNWTRYLWFWSRQLAELRQDPDWQLPEVPTVWAACTSALQDARIIAPDLKQGLLTLAQMLAANQLTPPWQLGLSLSDFADTFDDDMGYVDAFRLWGMSAFDDAEYVKKLLDSTHAPEEWRSWATEHFHVGLE